MHRHGLLQHGDPLRIVAIGGGHGLSALLHGLKLRMHGRDSRCSPATDLSLTAVVTVADDGGSSGRLRREFDILAPGDIRNCMVALSEDEALLSRLFQYRFETGKGLKGHTLGNLFLTALTELTGDFATAVQHASDVLAICGRIYPSTAANVSLQATMADGSVVNGETQISRSRTRIQRVTLEPQGAMPIPETLEAIANADLITLGPGSLFTSVIPNLLVQGIPEAIAASPATKVCFVNLMWQPGETNEFTASDHVRAIHEHAGRRLIDVAVVNSSPIPTPLKKSYAAQQSLPVENDVDALEALGVHVVASDLAAQGPKIRHDPSRLAEIAVELAAEARRRVTRAMTA